MAGEGMNKNQKNRVIAEWLGWRPHDFYLSEGASALVLEKLIASGCCVTEDREGVLITSPPDPVDHVVTSLVDTYGGWSLAISRACRAEAALALIRQEKK